MKMTWRAVAGAVALAGLSLALVGRPAQAQAYSWSITPWAGAYIPTSNTTSNLGTQISRDNSFISGLRITGWGKSALGLELEGGYAPARATVAGTTINSSRDTKVFVGDVKLMIGVGTSASAGGVYLEVGPALIRRGSDLTTTNASATDWGGVAGLGFRIPFSRAVSLRLDGEDVMYGGSFNGGPRTFQNDLILDAGITVAF